MDWKELAYARRSIRDYTSAPVAHEMLRALIDAAIQAPSAMNEQAWSFCVIEDRALLSRISDAAKSHVLHDLPESGANAHIRSMLKDPAFHIFYQAPALIIISSTTQGRWAAENCALAAENLMLAACAHGLGTCWIGFAQAWLATPSGRQALEIPAGAFPVAPIIVGHPKSIPPAVPRKAPHVRWIPA